MLFNLLLLNTSDLESVYHVIADNFLCLKMHLNFIPMTMWMNGVNISEVSLEKGGYISDVFRKFSDLFTWD